MDFSPITEFDLTGYEMSKPKCIEEITEETVLDKVSIDTTGELCLYGYLEAGFYVLEIERLTNYIRHLSVEIYDLNRNKLDLMDDFKGSPKLNTVFNIDETGYYYVKLTWDLRTIQEVTFKKLDYSINNKEEELRNSKGTLAGKYDYKKFSYFSKGENEAIKITNTSSSDLYIFVKNGIYTNKGNVFVSITSNNYIYINPDEYQKCYIFIASPLLEYSDITDDYETDYSFDVEVIVNENGIDENNPDILSTSFGNEYFVGGGFATRYVLIKIDKAGTYAFYEKMNGYEFEYNAYVGSKHGYKIYFEPGEYVMPLYDTTNELRVFSLRYEYVGE